MNTTERLALASGHVVFHWAEVAERLGVSASYVAAVEAGRRNLTLDQLANIANAMRLGINVSFIRPDGTPVRAKTRPAQLRRRRGRSPLSLKKQSLSGAEGVAEALAPWSARDLHTALTPA